MGVDANAGAGAGAGSRACRCAGLRAGEDARAALVASFPFAGCLRESVEAFRASVVGPASFAGGLACLRSVWSDAELDERSATEAAPMSTAAAPAIQTFLFLIASSGCTAG